MKQMEDPPFLRRRREDDGDDDENDRPRRPPRRIGQDLQQALREERQRILQERLRNIRSLYVYLRTRAGLDYYVARDILLMAFDADDVVLAFQNMPASLRPPGPAGAGL
jgi:hypothetical protein